MRTQVPYIGDGASSYDNESFQEKSTQEYYGSQYDADLEPPKIQTDNLGLSLSDTTPPTSNLGITLIDSPGENQNPYGLDLSPGLDERSYKPYLEPDGDRLPAYPQEDLPLSFDWPKMQIFIAPLLPLSVPLYDPDGKKDWQIGFSVPKLGFGPSGGFQIGWGDSGTTIGGHYGFGMDGVAGIYAAITINFDDFEKSELGIQPRLLLFQFNPDATKITAGEIKDGLENYLNEMTRQIHHLYRVPYP